VAEHGPRVRADLVSGRVQSARLPVIHLSGVLSITKVWTLALVLLGGAIVLGLLLARTLSWRDSRFAEPERLTSSVLARIVTATIFGLIAVRLAHDHDALHLALAGVLALFAIATVLIAALLVWGYFCFSRDNE
jgi:hypothetical protein